MDKTLVTAKAHLRNFNKSEKFVENLIQGTCVKYGILKINAKRNTGFIVLMGESKFVQYILRSLHSNKYLTNGWQHIGYCK